VLKLEKKITVNGWNHSCHYFTVNLHFLQLMTLKPFNCVINLLVNSEPMFISFK